MIEERDSNGRFVAGVWKGGPGRPTKLHEEKYRRIFAATIPPEKFQASCFQIWLDSVGKKLNKDGQLVDDPESTPFTRVNAFSRIAAYALGKPVDLRQVGSESDEILEAFRQFSDVQLEDIIEDAYEVVQRAEKARKKKGKNTDDEKLLTDGE